MLVPSKARKFIPLFVILLVAGFIITQFDLVRLEGYSIPIFGPKVSQPDPTAIHDPELEAYPEPVTVIAPSEDEVRNATKAASSAKQFEGIVDGVPPTHNHRELFSQSSSDGKFWPIVYTNDSTDAYNANIIPHPTKPNHWVVVAQRAPGDKVFTWPAVELTCTAVFDAEGTLCCVEEATQLPVIRSIIGACQGKHFFLNLGGGPRDARVFYGRDAPYAIYGSQSSYTCMGLWIHDLNTILPGFPKSAPGSWFRNTLEIHRPPPWGSMEKNYFVFWDSAGVMYAHYNFWPKRSFAQLYHDGSAGPDLGPAADALDQACFAKYMPSIPSTNGMESLHQATNSLQVTMCKRADPGCVATDENTFVIQVYHQTSNYHFHGVYEPFVWAFKRRAPFEIHAISQRPFWVSGRNPLTEETHSWRFREGNPPTNHTEMFYITSMNWRNSGQFDHGYLDDIIHIGFGIEDTRSGVLDVLASDLLQDLAYCDMD